MTADPTATLKRLMTAANLPSFRSLARAAGVSDWAVTQVRRDRVGQMRVEMLEKIAAALQVSLPELLHQFGVIRKPDQAVPGDRVATLEAEYQRLQAQQAQQATNLRQQFQREALTTIEPWLLQWPTVAHAVEKNPDLPASRVVPLVVPCQTLLEQWDVRAIASVGEEVPYDPQQHQLMSGQAAPGDRVRVRYAGFRQGETLLHRARVSPVEP